MTSNLFIGGTTLRLQCTDSTNNYARRLVHDRMPVEGTLVIADQQTQGRGQHGNSWLSEPEKNLTCSYVLRPVFLAATDQFLLSAVVSLAVADTVTTLISNGNVRIKWPNDILVNGRKIAGILIENILRGMNLNCSIAGIGLNVNQTFFPEGIHATSVKAIVNEPVSIAETVRILNSSLEHYYLKLRSGDHVGIMDGLNHRLYKKDDPCELFINGALNTVKVSRVLKTGQLELSHKDGSRTLHQHHEIRWQLSD